MGVVNTTYTFTSTDTITSAKMNNIIDDTTFTSDAIQGTTLQVVSPGKLAVSASGITSNELASNAVVTAKIADSNVTTAKIADSNVTTAKIADSNVTAAKIADSNVTAAKIADSNVTTAKIADANITQAKLASNVVGNGPAFKAYASTQTTLPPNGFTKIILDAESFDTNSNFNSSRFTPTVAGYYQINATFSTTSANSLGLLASIWKNGSGYAYGSGQVNATAVRSTVSDVVYLNGSTDYVELFGFHGSSFNIFSQAESATTFMSGCLIRSA
jgi:uncharacterized protein YjbI with pentapeptide repeats